jgi:hypothetical protein
MTLAPDVATLLARHGVRGPERAFRDGPFSGARITAFDGGDETWLLKRFNGRDDWMMRRTADRFGREAEFATSDVPAALPAGVAVPTVGAARDGDGFAVLMRDIDHMLFAPGGGIYEGAMELVLGRIAELHAAFEGSTLRDAAVHFCDPVARITLLAPEAGRTLVEEGRDFGILRGWQAFERLALPEAVRLVRTLFADPAPLRTLLDALPPTLLHGDAKAANMGVDGRGTLWLIDWALTMHAPVAVEVGWLLAVNSSRLPWPLDETLARYRTYLQRAAGARFAAHRWPQQERLIPRPPRRRRH